MRLFFTYIGTARSHVAVKKEFHAEVGHVSVQCTLPYFNIDLYHADIYMFNMYVCSAISCARAVIYMSEENESNLII